jgi:hypothetical protein
LQRIYLLLNADLYIQDHHRDLLYVNEIQYHQALSKLYCQDRLLLKINKKNLIKLTEFCLRYPIGFTFIIQP